MKQCFKKLSCLGLSMACLSVGAAEHPELKPFPAAKEGEQRFVIVLPPKEHGKEENFQVELIAGMTIPTDGVNRMRLMSRLEPRTLQGWGYSYYEVTGPSEVISTMMAPPEGAPMLDTFVRTAPLFARYNSRLPIVIYAPKDYEVHYRIWQAPSTFHKAESN